jgi:hypothetical protein
MLKEVDLKRESGGELTVAKVKVDHNQFRIQNNYYSNQDGEKLDGEFK